MRKARLGVMYRGPQQEVGEKFGLGDLMILRNSTAALLLLLLATPALAQSPLLYEWGPSQGLVQYTINTVVQDDNGYMWLGSESGASRFNGREFETFNHQTGFTNGAVRDIKVTPSGIYLLSEAGTLYVIHGDRADRVPTTGKVLAVLDPPTGGEPWLITENGLHRGLSAPPEELPLSVGPLLADAPPSTTLNGIVYLAVAESLYALDGVVSELATASARIEDIFVDPGGRIAVVTRGGVDLFDPDRGTLERLWSASGRALTCGTAGHGRLVFGTTEGALVVIDGSDPEIVERGLPKRAVMAVAVDREDNIWVGLDSGGVLLLPKAAFVSYTAADGVGTGDAFYVVADAVRSGVWVGTRNGGIAHITDERVNPLSEDQGLISNRVRALFQGSSGSLFIGTSAGIQVVDRSGSSWIFHAPPETLFQFFYEDHDGAVYAGSRTGMLVVSHDQKIFEIVPTQAGSEDLSLAGMLRHEESLFLASSRGVFEFEPDGSLRGPVFGEAGVRGLAVDGEGALWAVTMDRGGWRFKDGEWQGFGPDQGFDEQVRFVVIGPHGRPWFGGNQGVWSFPDTASTRLDTSNGLASDNIFLIRFDPDGNLWIGHNVGLDMFKEGRLLAHFDNRDGLADNELNTNGFTVDDQGRLWFCTMRGVSRIEPRAISRRGVEPLIHLRAVEVNGAATFLGSDQQGQPSLKLEHHENSLRFLFSGQSYVDPQDVLYSYQLEGYDDGWSRPLEVGWASYQKVPPGHYTFSVKCSSSDGLPSAIAHMTVEIVPAVWQRMGFRILAALAALGLAFGSLLFRSWRTQRRNLELERLVERRTRDLAAANSELRRLSITDPLTGLYNRRFFEEEIPGELASTLRVYRNSNEHPDEAQHNVYLALMMIDLDHFKRINDEYGHDTGDVVLQQFGGLIGRVIRTSDTIFRWGGEEFLLLARHTDPASTEILAERIRREVAVYRFESDGQRLEITCSIGYAPFPFLKAAPGSVGWAQLIHLADQALYLAKSRGRNAYVGVVPAQVEYDAQLQVVLSDLAAADREGYVRLESNIGESSRPGPSEG